MTRIGGGQIGIVERTGFDVLLHKKALTTEDTEEHGENQSAAAAFPVCAVIGA